MSVQDLVTRGIRGMAAYHVPKPALIRAKLDANELPYPLPPEAAEALGRELATVPFHRYPDADPGELREIVARDLDVAPESLVFGNGSDELIALLCATFAEPRPGKTRAAVLYPEPTFVVYRIATLGHGLEPVEIRLDDEMQLDFAKVEDAMTSAQPNLAFFALPNNPTGTLWGPERVAELAARHPGTLVISDEAYIQYGGRTLVPRLGELPNLIVMRTMSKIGLASLRIGYLTAAPAIVQELEKLRMPYNLGSLNQRAAVWLLRHQRAWLLERCRELLGERERLAVALRGLGLKVFPSEANLLLVRVGTPGDGRATAVWKALMARGILVRNFDRPGSSLAGCLRITPGTPAENELLLAELPAALAL